MTKPLSAAAFLAAALAVSGCDSGPKMVPVSGQVLVDGQPLTVGFVQVAPDGHRAATGKIGPDGRFTLTTTKEGDGTVTGTHKAAVIAVEVLTPSSQKWHAPKKYADVKTAELTVTVPGPTDALKVELTWAGGKPFVEKASD